MADFPSTQLNLLMKVRDKRDQQAWHEFVALYQPAIYRFGRQRGLQSADAQDLAQTVICTVADKIDEWQPDPSRGKFRTWLSRIARNQAVSIFRRRSRSRIAESEILECHSEDADHSELTLQYRREIFRHAARQVRHEFEETSWQAFWMTAVQGISIQEATATLSMSAGAVYTARSRIIARLRMAVSRIEDEDESLTDLQLPSTPLTGDL